MAKQKAKVEHAEVVSRFSVRLKELRRSRGLTQAQLAREAHVTPGYVWRLESGGAAPGIDLVERLASALGTSIHDLVPIDHPPETLPFLQGLAKKLFEDLMATASREDLLMLCPLFARLAESPTRRR